MTVFKFMTQLGMLTLTVHNDEALVHLKALYTLGFQPEVSCV